MRDTILDTMGFGFWITHQSRGGEGRRDRKREEREEEGGGRGAKE